MGKSSMYISEIFGGEQAILTRQRMKRMARKSSRAGAKKDIMEQEDLTTTIEKTNQTRISWVYEPEWHSCKRPEDFLFRAYDVAVETAVTLSELQRDKEKEIATLAIAGCEVDDIQKSVDDLRRLREQYSDNNLRIDRMLDVAQQDYIDHLNEQTRRKRNLEKVKSFDYRPLYEKLIVSQ